jgi:NADP-dependent 3-hydroxy acid dehydrogenase YdfG
MSDKGKTIIVTGAGGGVGKATARAFLDTGWKIGFMGRRSEILEEATAGHENAPMMPCDVRDELAVEDAFAKAFQAGVVWMGRSTMRA